MKWRQAPNPILSPRQLAPTSEAKDDVDEKDDAVDEGEEKAVLKYWVLGCGCKDGDGVG